MKKRLSHFICCLLTSCVVLSETCTQAATYQPTVQSVSTQAESTITVSDFASFSNALGKYSHIIIDKDFALTLSAEETTKQTIPLDIPGGTTIEGTNANITITSRGPIQITGDNVTFKNLQLHFDSSDAMGSVPQREIFLAGHSLTFDNVDTYLEGSGGSFGGITGTEKELLPTIYGGGFHTNKNIGSNASLTVNRADKNDKTPIFQDIIMGNEGQSGKYTAYKGKAELSLDAHTQVRGKVSTELNSESTISVTGTTADEIQKLPYITGNANTTLKISGCNITKSTSVNGIGNINIINNGTFTPSASTILNNVSVEGGSCLDLTDMSNATINGDFSGGTTDKKADIIVSLYGRITLNKKVTGSSQLYITNRKLSCTDMPFKNWQYIIVKGDHSQTDFNFAQRYIDNGYSLKEKDNIWSCEQNENDNTIFNVEITDFTNNIYINDIPGYDDSLDANSPSMNIKWKYSNENYWDAYKALKNSFYTYSTIINTDYWNSSDSAINSKTDWSNPVELTFNYDDNLNSGKYYLIHNETEDKIKSGKYTLLLFSESIEGKKITTVGDVKALKSLVIGNIDINFTDTKPSTGSGSTGSGSSGSGSSGSGSTGSGSSSSGSSSSGSSSSGSSGSGSTSSGSSSSGSTGSSSSGSSSTGSGSSGSGSTGSGSTGNNNTPETTKPTATPTPSAEVIPTVAPTVIPTVTPAVTSAPPTAVPTASAKPDTTSTPTTSEPTTQPDDTTNPTAKPTAPTSSPTAKPTHKHKVTQIVQKATSKKSGSITYVCKICNKVIKKTTIPALKKTEITKFKVGKNSFTITFKKQTKNTTGYQISYSTKKNLSDDKKKTVANSKKSTATISRLKSNKKYYIRIRTYKDVKVNGKTVKMYGEWSEKETITTK